MTTTNQSVASTPVFSVLSRYNKAAGIQTVRFGANTTVLESELNELQQVGEQRVKESIKALFTNGVVKDSTMLYSGGVFSISDTYVVLEGDVIYISSLSISARNGDSIYFDTWTSEATHTTSIRKYGNAQEVYVPNYFVDPLIGTETSRRQIKTYDLSIINNVENHQYLLLGSIINGKFTQSVSLVTPKTNAPRIEELFIASSGGQQGFTLTRGKYKPGMGQLQVFLNGIKLPQKAFEETNDSSFNLKAPVPAKSEVLAAY